MRQLFLSNMNKEQSKERCHPSPNFSIVQCAHVVVIVLPLYFFMAGYNKVRVYTEKTQVTRGLFDSKALHSKYIYLRSFLLSQEAY